MVLGVFLVGWFGFLLIKGGFLSNYSLQHGLAVVIMDRTGSDAVLMHCSVL